MLIEHIQDFAQMTVRHGHQGFAAAAQMLRFGRVKLVGGIGWMGEIRSVIVPFFFIQVQVIFGAVIGLVRVKSLDP